MSMKLNAERLITFASCNLPYSMAKAVATPGSNVNMILRALGEAIVQEFDIWRQMAKTQMFPMGLFVNEPYRPLKNSPCVLKTMSERYPPREPKNDTDLLRGAW